MKTVRNYFGTAIATYGYDQMGRRSSLGMYNNTDTSYAYDAAGRLSSLAHDFAGTANDVAFSYAYNPAGQIASRTANNDAYSYTGVANQNVTDTHNGLNQIVTAGIAAVTHDGRGNTTSIGSASYTYTADNKLATGGGSNFYYDMVGRMVHSSAAARDFLYDIGSGRMIGEKAAHGGAVQLVYVPGAGVDETLAVWDPNANATDQLHTDERGSVIAVSDASGNVHAINRYDDYGNPQGWGGTGTQSGRFGYTGQAWMPELGMYNYKARIYNPRLEGGGGRFMQTDPIGYGDGMNLYAYVSGDPINLTDPSGTTGTCGRNGQPACPPAATPDFDGGGTIIVVGARAGGSQGFGGLPPGAGGRRVQLASAAVCETTMICEIERDHRLFLEGRMTREELQERRNARLFGVSAGSILVIAPMIGVRILVANITSARAASSLIGPHILKALKRRGWTEEAIRETVRKPERIIRGLRDTRRRSGGGRNNDPATGFENARGDWLIRNDRTGDIVQISNRNNPDWRRPW